VLNLYGHFFSDDVLNYKQEIKPMKKQKPGNSDRRDFLRGSVVAGAGVTVAAAVPGVALAEPVEPETKVAKNENYRLTRHISDYYKSTL
jgi:hypothetical protein